MRKLTRRAFIGTGLLASGALVIGVSIQPGNRSEKVADLIADADEHVFDIWIKISPDNTVTIIVPHAEMGQGVHTTLALMLADELDADWDKVIISEAPAQEAYTNHMLLKGFVARDIDFPNFLSKYRGWRLPKNRKNHQFSSHRWQCIDQIHRSTGDADMQAPVHDNC